MNDRRARILVAGVGNLFLGDDGFGPEVARRLLAATSRPDVRVVDVGIRGLHLAYELLDGYDLLVLVDTARRGEEPGTITVMEVDPASPGQAVPDAHDMDPAHMLAVLADMGGSVGRMLVVGCEPADVGEGIGLSPPVAGAVEAAVAVVQELVEQELAFVGKGS
ncbi:MAG TPA: hydrogenase maturation protease [Acidimicrobiales bacterium]|nr:hydrogenase maturation protease [Acidimicrobiales bacterium]